MKRIFVLFLAVFAIFSIYADEPYVNTRPIALQAGLNEALNISVNRIPSQSENYLQGMPFNIDDSQVQYVAGSSGRLIANWSVLANTDFNLTFTLEPLKRVVLSSEGEVDNPALDYILTFEYLVSYGISDSYIDSQFSLNMGDSTPSVIGKYVTVLDDVPVAKDANGNATFKINITEGLTDGGTISSFIGSLEGGIYFMFTPESTKALAEDPYGGKYKAGNYRATVTINMEVAR